MAIDNARLYHEAERANHAKDHFLAALSHELRTPLTPALLLSESLLGPYRATLTVKLFGGVQFTLKCMECVCIYVRRRGTAATGRRECADDPRVGGAGGAAHRRPARPHQDLAVPRHNTRIDGYTIFTCCVCVCVCVVQEQIGATLARGGGARAVESHAADRGTRDQAQEAPRLDRLRRHHRPTQRRSRTVHRPPPGARQTHFT
jgi:hypothetical protein